MGMDQELYRFRAIIGHQDPLLASDPDWNGSRYNVQVEWETGEITFEPLSIIAADDPVTCAAYAKENDLLALEGVNPNRDSPNGYPTVTPTELQPVTLAH